MYCRLTFIFISEITEEDEESAPPEENDTKTEDKYACESSKAAPLDEEYGGFSITVVFHSK